MLLITAVFFGVKEMISTPIEKKLICESFIVQIVFKYKLNNSDWALKNIQNIKMLKEVCFWGEAEGTYFPKHLKILYIASSPCSYYSYKEVYTVVIWKLYPRGKINEDAELLIMVSLKST